MRARCCGNRYPLTRFGNVTAIVKFQFDGQSPDVVILSERSESKDLCTNFIANEEQTRRFFDSVLRTPLRMTC